MRLSCHDAIIEISPSIQSCIKFHRLRRWARIQTLENNNPQEIVKATLPSLTLISIITVTANKHHDRYTDWSFMRTKFPPQVCCCIVEKESFRIKTMSKTDLLYSRYRSMKSISVLYRPIIYTPVINDDGHDSISHYAFGKCRGGRRVFHFLWEESER